MKILGKLNFKEMDLKRLYLKGLFIEDSCQNCGEKNSIDLSENYPYKFDEEGNCFISYICEKCEQGHDKKMKLNISISEG